MSVNTRSAALLYQEAVRATSCRWTLNWVEIRVGIESSLVKPGTNTNNTMWRLRRSVHEGQETVAPAVFSNPQLRPLLRKTNNSRKLRLKRLRLSLLIIESQLLEVKLAAFPLKILELDTRLGRTVPFYSIWLIPRSFPLAEYTWSQPCLYRRLNAPLPLQILFPWGVSTRPYFFFPR